MSESLLRVCRACDRYTMAANCPNCRAPTRSPHPARFSPQDKYGIYRRRLYASGPGTP